ADWQAAWDLNVMAPLRAMRAAAPGMRERGWGRIVNVASTAGKRPSARMPEYSVAKAAELSLSRLFADRYAADGVLVNAICPGPTKSELWMERGGLLDQSRELAGTGSREEALEDAGSKRPIGRRADVRRHAGEISFPGGRRDPGESLLETAVREAEEEIGLDPAAVRIAGALPPVGTFVTGYRVHPFVGTIAEGLAFRPSPDEVAS